MKISKQAILRMLIAVTLCVPSLLSAQTSKSTLKEKIIITADELSDDHFSSYLDVIDVEPTDHSQSLASFLKNKKGVSVTQTGGIGAAASASIRGVGTGKAEQVLVLLDGVRLNTAKGTGVDLSRIPLSIVEKIEVIRGGESALYGADAVGGVINVVTKKNTSQFNVNITRKSWGKDTEKDHQLSLLVGKRFRNASILASAYSQRDKGRFHFRNPITKDHQKRDENNFVTRGFLLKGAYKPTKNFETFLLEEFSFTKLKTRDPLTDDGTQDNFGVGRQKDFRSLTELKTIWSLSDTSALTFKAPFRWNRLQFIEEETTFNAQNKYDYRNFHVGPQISYRSSLSDVAVFSLLSEVTYDRLNSKSHSNSPDKINVGLVGKSDFFIGSNITITPVARFDHSQDIYTVTNPKLGMTYQPTKGLTFKSNIARNFRSPSFDELYFESRSAWGTFVGNENLRPERSWDGDLGFEWENDYVKLGHSWFVSKIKNLITWTQTSKTDSTFVNLDDQRIWGLEASLDSKLPFMKHLYVTQNYTWLKSDLPYRPQHRANTTLKWENNIARLYTNYQFTSSRKTHGMGRSMLKTFHVFDIGTDINITETSTISAKVENIFNRAYENVAYFPMPGRTVSLSYSVSL